MRNGKMKVLCGISILELLEYGVLIVDIISCGCLVVAYLG
jgi:hypothetical protein